MLRDWPSQMVERLHNASQQIEHNQHRQKGANNEEENSIRFFCGFKRHAIGVGLWTENNEPASP